MIDTVEACDILLARALKIIQRLERKHRNLGELIGRHEERADRISQERVSVQLLLENFSIAYHALPEGKYKVNLNVQIKRLELRKARLDKSAITCNVHTLLAKQVQYNKLDSQLSVMDSYVMAVQSLKATLNKPVLTVSHSEKDLVKSRSSALTEFQSKAGNAVPPMPFSTLKTISQKKLVQGLAYFEYLAKQYSEKNRPAPTDTGLSFSATWFPRNASSPSS